MQRENGRLSSPVALLALCLRIPLASPYKLAFGSIEAFDTIIVIAGANGSMGFGEATILTGYTDETLSESWRAATDLVARYSGGPVSALIAETDRLTEKAPFVATAFRSAIEMTGLHPSLVQDTERRVPLLAIINATDESGIAAEVEKNVVEGYRTLKIKVGFEARRDLARMRFVQSLVANTDVLLTVDANQGYSREDGCYFAAELAPNNIQFFEQACHKDDWDAAAAVARASNVPVMLDESIYGLADAERAAALGAAQFIKLKLMKLGGLDRLIDAMERVKALGLEPVLGNGVATDIGCWMEAAAAHGRLQTAGEMNGFLKPRRPLVTNPLRVDKGELVIPAGWRPVLDAEAVAACRVDMTGDAQLIAVP